jgi:hypothetical protein
MQRRIEMRNLTTPQAVLGGLALIALAIASIPYSSNIVTPAHASGIQKVYICSYRNPNFCADVFDIKGIYSLQTHDYYPNTGGTKKDMR